MPNAAVVGAALNAFTIRQYAIYVGGLDVRAYVSIDTVRVTEAGPGDVSEATFTIEDTTGAVPLPASGSEVSVWDLILGYPIFAGYLNDYSASVIGLGRNITIHAFGLEALLDWYVAPANAFIPALFPAVGVSYLANTMFPGAGLYAPQPDPMSGAFRDGNATWPIGSFNDGAQPVQGTIHTEDGSFRNSIGLLSKWAYYGGAPLPARPFLATVDFYRRLRAWEVGREPSDYTNLTVTDTYAGPLVAASLKYDVHPGDVVRTVYVVGGAAAGSGYASDGSGIIGRQQIITDTSSLTAADLAQIAQAFFATQTILIRGSLVLENYVPAAGTVHPGSTLTLTDTQVSLTAQVYTIASIEKTFQGGTQTWVVHFGGRAPSLVETLRTEYAASRAWASTPAA